MSHETAPRMRLHHSRTPADVAGERSPVSVPIGASSSRSVIAPACQGERALLPRDAQQRQECARALAGCQDRSHRRVQHVVSSSNRSASAGWLAAVAAARVRPARPVTDRSRSVHERSLPHADRQFRVSHVSPYRSLAVFGRSGQHLLRREVSSRCSPGASKLASTPQVNLISRRRGRSYMQCSNCCRQVQARRWRGRLA
jgi:hypothetical protein